MMRSTRAAFVGFDSQSRTAPSASRPAHATTYRADAQQRWAEVQAVGEAGEDREKRKWELGRREIGICVPSNARLFDFAHITQTSWQVRVAKKA